MLPERRARVVRVDGVFDHPAALRLGQILAEVEPGAALCVDLSHACDCSASALAALAWAAGRRPEVRVDILGPAGSTLGPLRAPGAGGRGRARWWIPVEPASALLGP